jgi:hypothetical protein
LSRKKEGQNWLFTGYGLIHAKYNEFEVILALDGTTLEGSLPIRQMKLVEAWAAIHEDELHANWQLLCEGEAAFKIDPLK